LAVGADGLAEPPPVHDAAMAATTTSRLIRSTTRARAMRLRLRLRLRLPQRHEQPPIAVGTCAPVIGAHF
jgi:hypothetical protein